MSKENAGKFQDLLSSDEELQAKFRAAVEAYAGDAGDEHAAFEAIVAPLAEGAGLPFTYEEGKELALDGAELTDEQLEAAAGGWAFCILMGAGSSEVEATDRCTCDEQIGQGWGACYIQGVGYFYWDA